MKKFNILQRIALFKVRSKKTFRIMKLTTFLMSVTILNAFANNTYSQNTLLNLNMKDVPMKTVFKAIEDQSEFFFLYSSKMIDIDQKVDINVTDKKITEVLDKLLANSDIIYSVRNRQILLVNKEAALELQQKKVTGTITDVNKQPVAGANVVVKGTPIGAITDADGKYTIEVPPSGKTLTVSFIGYISQEVQIGKPYQYGARMVLKKILPLRFQKYLQMTFQKLPPVMWLNCCLVVLLVFKQPWSVPSQEEI